MNRYLKRNITNRFISFALTLSFVLTNVSFPYAQETNGNDISIVDETISGTSIETYDEEVNTYATTDGGYVVFPGGNDNREWYWTSDGIKYVDNPQATNLSIGDYLSIGNYLGEDILWRYVADDENGALILSDGILCIKYFDNKGNITTGSHGRGYGNIIKGYNDRTGGGSSYWGDSNIRDWLNSNLPMNEIIWSCGNDSNYSDDYGFLKGFTDSELNLIKTVNQKQLLTKYEYSQQGNDNPILYNDDLQNVMQNYENAYCEYSSDRMFLLDIKQLKEVYDNLGDYYIGYPTIALEEANDNYSSLSHSSPWTYYLRTPYNNAYVRDVSKTKIQSSPTILPRGIRPAFYLNTENLNFVSGDGSIANPYRIDNTNINEDEPYMCIIKNGEFNYASSINGIPTNVTSQYHYNDSYFMTPSNKGMESYNPNLATMSLCLAMSAFGSGDIGTNYTNKSKNVEQLLISELGFKKYSTNKDLEGGFDSYHRPTDKSIGVAIASKVIEDNEKKYTLIAVAVRGANYEREWASNFRIGENGQADGFSEAKDNVLNFLTEYIVKNNISGDVKIWITGYSRAAATANLTAGALDNNYNLGNNVNLSSKDLYAYCFETPMGEIKANNPREEKYNNIFNIVNPNDPVPKVAMAKLGFDRYGIDIILPSNENTVYYSKYKALMLNQLRDLPDYSGYSVDGFNNIDIDFDKLKMPTSPLNRALVFIDSYTNKKNQSVYLDELINDMTTSQIKTRKNFKDSYQEPISYILDLYFGADYDDQERLKAHYKLRWLEDVVVPILFADSDNRITTIDEVIENGFKNYTTVTYDKNKLNSSVNFIVDFLYKYGKHDPNKTATLLMNLDSIGSAHNPNLCFAWMRAMDDNYTDTPIKLKDGKYSADYKFDECGGLYDVCGKYRVARIKCPVDCEVIDEAGNVVAKIANDIPQEINGSSIVSSIDENGDKIFYLPSDTDYNIKIEATDIGNVNYTINEFDPNIGNYTRIVNYYNIPIEEGDVLVAEVPEYDKSALDSYDGTGSTVIYSLKKDSETFVADLDISGKEVTENNVCVDISSNNKIMGTVFGGGIVNAGDYIVIEAVSNDGYIFKGWYEDDQFVSTDSEYRFMVIEDKNIVGVFEADPNKVTETTTETTTKSTSRSSSGGGGGGGGGGSVTATYTVKFESNGGSKITSQSVKKNETVSEPTKPTKIGYVFTGWYTDRYCLDKYSFSTKVTKSFTLYAGWKKDTSDVIEEKPTEPDTTTPNNITEPTLNNTVRVTIGSKAVSVGYGSYEMDVAPYIQASSNSTLVPLRFVTIAVSGGDLTNADRNNNIAWNAETKTATILANNRTIKFTAGSNIVNVDGKDYSMDYGVTAEITDNRMFIPFRALGTVLGVDVDWDTETKTAIYKNH